MKYVWQHSMSYSVKKGLLKHSCSSNVFISEIQTANYITGVRLQRGRGDMWVSVDMGLWFSLNSSREPFSSMLSLHLSRWSTNAPAPSA